MSDYALETAARFGEIPFVEFSKELVTGIFDSLVEAHALQMEEYADFVNSLTQDLSVYINNTQDGVTFDQIADFVLKYELPEVDDATLTTILDQLESPPTGKPIDTGTPAPTDQWWGALINTLGPAVADVISNVGNPNKLTEQASLESMVNSYNDGVTSLVPDYSEIRTAIASLVASNKYSLLQNMAKQGMMRLVVTEGEIETKITFSIWNTSSSGSETGYKQKNVDKAREKNVKGGGFLGLFKKKRKSRTKNRTVTVNTAKSYQRDSSGTRVDIFGRVLIRFKTDYAPLNG
jgi:hypothetical protein